MKKKILTLGLALAMCFAMATPAFAAEGDEAAAPSATHDDVTVTKAYDLTGGKAEPAETLSFAVEANETNPDASLITVADIDTSKTKDIVVKFPTYTKMGEYVYTVTEVGPGTLGVTYDTNPVEVHVTVVNEKAGDGTTDVLKAYVGVYKVNGEEQEKIAGDDPEIEPGTPAFTNEYGLGQLTVTKKVTGNLASNTKEFDITVAFTCPEESGAAGNPISYTVAGGEAQTVELKDGKASVTVQLKHDTSAVFTDIPAGVTYTVEEAAKHTEGDKNSEEGYTVSYDFGDEKKAIAADDKDEVTVTNNKETEIQTGISLDSLPYIVMAAVIAAVVVAMVLRRRNRAEF